MVPIVNRCFSIESRGPLIVISLMLAELYLSGELRVIVTIRYPFSLQNNQPFTGDATIHSLEILTYSQRTRRFYGYTQLPTSHSPSNPLLQIELLTNKVETVTAPPSSSSKVMQI